MCNSVNFFFHSWRMLINDQYICHLKVQLHLLYLLLPNQNPSFFKSPNLGLFIKCLLSFAFIIWPFRKLLQGEFWQLRIMIEGFFEKIFNVSVNKKEKKFKIEELICFCKLKTAVWVDSLTTPIKLDNCAWLIKWLMTFPGCEKRPYK